MQDALIGLVVLSAVVRSAWLVVGLARLIPVHRRARTRRWGAVEALTLAEVPIFLALTALLVLRTPEASASGVAALAAAAAGALLCLLGVGVSIWAIATTYRLGVILDAGHFVKQEHPLITTGAYGLVRNPMYLGVILLWLGIGLAFGRVALLAVTVLYVLPTYWLYIRAEEAMLADEFGPAYEDYVRKVGRLLPRLRPRVR